MRRLCVWCVRVACVRACIVCRTHTQSSIHDTFTSHKSMAEREREERELASCILTYVLVSIYALLSQHQRSKH